MASRSPRPSMGIQPSQYSTTWRKVTGPPAPPKMTGGCGFCTGFGNDRLGEKQIVVAVERGFVHRPQGLGGEDALTGDLAPLDGGHRGAHRPVPVAPTPYRKRPPESTSMEVVCLSALIGWCLPTRQMPVPTLAGRRRSGRGKRDNGPIVRQYMSGEVAATGYGVRRVSGIWVCLATQNDRTHAVRGQRRACGPDRAIRREDDATMCIARRTSTITHPSTVRDDAASSRDDGNSLTTMSRRSPDLLTENSPPSGPVHDRGGAPRADRLRDQISGARSAVRASIPITALPALIAQSGQYRLALAPRTGCDPTARDGDDRWLLLARVHGLYRKARADARPGRGRCVQRGRLVGRPDRAGGFGAVPDVAALGEAVACYTEGS